jgi:hypothetical protein
LSWGDQETSGAESTCTVSAIQKSRRTVSQADYLGDWFGADAQAAAALGKQN